MTCSWLRALAVFAFTLAGIAIPVRHAKAADAGSHRIPVMIVVVSHFSSREDVHDPRPTDIPGPEHPQQIAEVVRRPACIPLLRTAAIPGTIPP